MNLFFFNDTATTEIYTLSLHDALPISGEWPDCAVDHIDSSGPKCDWGDRWANLALAIRTPRRPSDGTVEIPLRGLGGRYTTIIDAPDLAIVAGVPWRAKKNPAVNTPYVVWNGTQSQRYKQQFMHRWLMEPPDDLVVDHINGDGLDNRRANLRICTAEENFLNSRPAVGRLFKGTSRLGKNRYQAQCRGVYLGSFDTEVAAALAYDRAATEMFGEFARLNFPNGPVS